MINDKFSFIFKSGEIEVSKRLMPCPSMGPKWFWTDQIILVEYQSFWTGPICFGRVQIILVRFKSDFSTLIFIIWTRPKWIGLVLNNWYSTKMIWKVQNHFGPIEGQGINLTPLLIFRQNSAFAQFFYP